MITSRFTTWMKCIYCPGTNSTDGRMKRDVYMDGLTYSDLFPGYPSGLRLRKDVAIFVSL